MTSVSFDPIPIWLPSRGGYTALSFRVDAWRLPLIPNPLLTPVVVTSHHERGPRKNDMCAGDAGCRRPRDAG